MHNLTYVRVEIRMRTKSVFIIKVTFQRTVLLAVGSVLSSLIHLACLPSSLIMCLLWRIMNSSKMSPDSTVTYICLFCCEPTHTLSLSLFMAEVIVSVSSFCESNVLSASITFSNRALKGRSETDNHLNTLTAQTRQQNNSHH